MHTGSGEYALLLRATTHGSGKCIAFFHFKACFRRFAFTTHARYVRRFAEYFSVTVLERSSHATATDRAPAPGNLFASLFHVIAHAENATPSVFRYQQNT